MEELEVTFYGFANAEARQNQKVLSRQAGQFAKPTSMASR